jgi:hypothetical protein
MRFLVILCTIITTNVFGQSANIDFNSAYAENPIVPKGLLEAVSWTNTHMRHLENELAACNGMPMAYGIMGLHDNGQNYFLENGKKVAKLSGVSVDFQKQSALLQVKAYAKAVSELFSQEGITAPNAENVRWVLEELTEIPDSGTINRLARDLQTSQVILLMTDIDFSATHNFTPKNYNLEGLYGEENSEILFGESIRFTNHGIMNDQGALYTPLKLDKTADYGPALWNPAATCNFSSRAGIAISAITIHTVQGSYSGCISWFQNCSAGVSAHYVIRSSDGQVTQMVNEADKAWHVGSENPYTIGYEHEGFVSDPSWYTMEMYNSSADLSRDVVNSGYGIPAPRTYFGDASATVETLGGCTKIKGHQHFANQSHTDPGINWDWELYYQLINDNPAVTTLTTPTGTSTDSGGASGDYQDDERNIWVIEPTNAQDITLDFTSFNIEQDWDYLFIYDGNTINAPLIGMYTGSISPGTITSSGSALTIEFRSDCATTAPGWVANWTATLSDLTAPVTSIVSPGIWQTDDFTVQFTDSDTQSGISQRFYLAAENSNSPDDWYAKGALGFAHESFDIQDNNWLAVTGTFSLNGGTYRFADANEQNSNTYIAVDQSDAYAYMYEWDQLFAGANTNQRAGIHFFCDNPNLPNRGNSYFVYLRETDDKVQIYSVDNDVFNLEMDADLVINADQSYNCKVIYDAGSGLIEVYIDNAFIGAWTDTTPLTTGGFVSLRTAGAIADYDNLKVFKSRSTSEIITAGTGDVFSIESIGAVPTGMISSVVVDNAKNVSNEASEFFLMDFSAPEINSLNDGIGSDIDTFTTNTINANWDAFDIHSDILEYEYAIGTLPVVDDVVGWTNNGLGTACSEVLANPTYGQVYHVSIRVTNQAGLVQQFMSNGQRFIDDLSTIEEALETILLYPNPAINSVTIDGAEANDNVSIYDRYGRLVLSVEDPTNAIDLTNLASGHYSLMLKRGQSFVVKQLIKK